MRVAAIQSAAFQGDYPAQMGILEKLVRQAAENGADMICLPELMTTPYFARSHDLTWRKSAEPLTTGETYRRIQTLAVELKRFILATCYELDRENYYNTAFVVSPEGDLVGKYRKTHVPLIESVMAYEKLFFDPGEELPVFSVLGTTIGILICYDRSFPEAWRTLALKGAQIIFVPTSSSGFRGSMYVQELQVAAQQHQVFVVAANKAGKESLPGEPGEITFYGKSSILGPDGRLIAALEREEAAILLADLDLAEVNIAREKLNYYRDRRIDLYLK